jgi:hypothetical protein
LQLRVWGPDTTVDFDHSLGTAINKIREALGDSAENPRFVETLARRGYRFIAPVTHPSTPLQAIAVTSVASPEQVPSLLLSDQEATFPAPAVMPAAPPAKASSRRNLLVAASVFIVVILAAAIGYYAGSSHQADDPIRITQITQNGRISPGAPSMENLPAAATDGIRLYASVIAEGRPALSQVSINLGDVQSVPLPSEIASPSLGDISPDGSRLLLRSHLSPESEQPLWVVPTTGGSALRVSNILAHDQQF